MSRSVTRRFPPTATTVTPPNFREWQFGSSWLTLMFPCSWPAPRFSVGMGSPRGTGRRAKWGKQLRTRRWGRRRCRSCAMHGEPLVRAWPRQGLRGRALRFHLCDCRRGTAHLVHTSTLQPTGNLPDLAQVLAEQPPRGIACGLSLTDRRACNHSKFHFFSSTRRPMCITSI